MNTVHPRLTNHSQGSCICGQDGVPAWKPHYPLLPDLPSCAFPGQSSPLQGPLPARAQAHMPAHACNPSAVPKAWLALFSNFAAPFGPWPSRGLGATFQAGAQGPEHDLGGKCLYVPLAISGSVLTEVGMLALPHPLSATWRGSRPEGVTTEGPG